MRADERNWFFALFWMPSTFRAFLVHSERIIERGGAYSCLPMDSVVSISDGNLLLPARPFRRREERTVRTEESRSSEYPPLCHEYGKWLWHMYCRPLLSCPCICVSYVGSGALSSVIPVSLQVIWDPSWWNIRRRCTSHRTVGSPGGRYGVSQRGLFCLFGHIWCFSLSPVSSPSVTLHSLFSCCCSHVNREPHS